jgi:hypothetical protein
MVHSKTFWNICLFSPCAADVCRVGIRGLAAHLSPSSRRTCTTAPPPQRRAPWPGWMSASSVRVTPPAGHVAPGSVRRLSDDARPRSGPRINDVRLPGDRDQQRATEQDLQRAAAADHAPEPRIGPPPGTASTPTSNWPRTVFSPSVSSVAACESAPLFAARRRGARVRHLDQNADAIAEIVLRLDGLPLAIELPDAGHQRPGPLTCAVSVRRRGGAPHPYGEAGEPRRR